MSMFENNAAPRGFLIDITIKMQQLKFSIYNVGWQNSNYKAAYCCELKSTIWILTE